MRSRLLILASAIAMLGWGTVLPYQYAYAADTRGWGTMLAALASTLFSVGALIAAPLGGRLADRHPPVTVAVASKVVAAVGAGSLVLADAPWTFLAGMFVFGLGITSAGPAQSVLVLRWVDNGDRRRIFAWLFTGQALGMAIGAFFAGYVVDLDRLDGMWPAFATASIGFLVSALLLLLAGFRAPDAQVSSGPPAAAVGTRRVLAVVWGTPTLRWAAVVTAALALGFYAQFESGLPAFALTELGVQETTIGLAAAVNCLVIIALQMLVVRLTANRSAASLLIVVGSIWAVSWLVLIVAQLLPGIGATLFVVTFGIFAVGETMYAPVLNPLTASLAPEGMVGSVLGIFAALQTGVSAVGPLVAGVLLGAGLPWPFLVLHLMISLLAVVAAVRLRGLLRHGATARMRPEDAALLA